MIFGDDEFQQSAYSVHRHLTLFYVTVVPRSCDITQNIIHSDVCVPFIATNELRTLYQVSILILSLHLFVIYNTSVLKGRSCYPKLLRFFGTELNMQPMIITLRIRSHCRTRRVHGKPHVDFYDICPTRSLTMFADTKLVR